MYFFVFDIDVLFMCTMPLFFSAVKPVAVVKDYTNHGLATEEGRRTSFPPLRYGCQLQPENQNKHG
jgi:hypothetical protein